ncbi:MAG: heavy metal translocating P-type ATPase [Rubrivivax sp.]
MTEPAPRQAVRCDLELGGLTCGACALVIEEALAAVPGVRQVRVNGASHHASVDLDPARSSEAQLLQAVRAAGYDAAPATPEGAEALRRRERRTTLWRLLVAAICAMQVMMLATPAYVASAGTLEPDLRQLLNWGSWVLSVPALWFSGAPFLVAGWRGLLRGRIGMETPVALGLAVTFCASTVATFDPTGPLGQDVWFDSLTMFLAFLWFGRWLEMNVRHRAARQVEAAAGALPDRAWRIAPDGTLHEVQAASLRPGDRVWVRSGDTVPADGWLERGHALVAEALLTGEPGAVARAQGELLLAGSLNHGQPFGMRVQHAGRQTRQAGIVGLMRETLAQRPQAVRVADRWAVPFLWGLLALAAAAALRWGVSDPAQAVRVVVSVLIVTCPCALSLATPATMVAAAGGLARRGVLVRRLDALERLAHFDHVVFDKTGTLTPEQSAVEVVHTAQPRLQWARAASLARRTSHPLAAALATGAPGMEGEPDWREVHEEPGQGMQALDEAGRTWRLGSAAWVGGFARDEEARVWLGCEGVVLAGFCFDESARPEAAVVVAALQRQGIGVSMLSGDGPARAAALAQAVGIARVQAGASAQDKLDVVLSMRKEGRQVAAVGDGINDAPLLAAADVSFAMGTGALAAQEGADAVIVGGNLRALLDARDTAMRTLRIVRQNLAWAAAYNVACIPMALMGWLPPWLAGLGMAGSSLAVILNAQRASGGERAQTPTSEGDRAWTSSTS